MGRAPNGLVDLPGWCFDEFAPIRGDPVAGPFSKLRQAVVHPAEVYPGAGPDPVLRPLSEPRPNGISFDLAERIPEVLIIHWT